MWWAPPGQRGELGANVGQAWRLSSRGDCRQETCITRSKVYLASDRHPRSRVQIWNASVSPSDGQCLYGYGKEGENASFKRAFAVQRLDR